MKPALIVAWLIAFAAVVLVVSLYSGNQGKQDEWVSLQQQTAGLDELRRENESLRALNVNDAELEELRQANRELYKLRADVMRLRSEAERQRQAASRPQPAPRGGLEGRGRPSTPPSLPSPPAIPQTQQEAQERRLCIQNLVALERAKANLGNVEPVTLELLAPFFEAGLPVCPAGGVYTPNEIGAPPACSVHGTPFSGRR